VKPPRNKTILIAGVAAAAVGTTAALALAVWPALTRPDPPAEAAGDGGLSIRVVEPPKAPIPRASPLDVGLSEADQAMAKSRAALFAGAPALPPAEPLDDRWERERTGGGFALARQLREEEQTARRERERREAQEQADRDRRWDEEREGDHADDQRQDDRYAPPLPPSDAPPPPEPQ